MGRHKKEVPKIEIDVPESFIKEKPDRSFCIKCKNNDIRANKENLNMGIITLLLVAKKLKIRNKTLAIVCSEINKWALR